ncbi:MAG TPA: TraR/DksA C4-type zinc finger protein [Candidatus Omnitrophota bacterium]|nr:TraR/DksA C4-type zinc finger protein [Candidatus Omnitrophota bacterium]
MDEIDFATERAEAFTRVALNAVLARVGEAGPSSGICRSCREPIEAERLRANQHARLCRECAAEEEAHSQRARRCGPR